MKLIVVVTARGYDLWHQASAVAANGWKRAADDPPVYSKWAGEAARADVLLEDSFADLAEAAGYLRDTYLARLAEFEGVCIAAHRSGVWQQALARVRGPRLYIAPLPHRADSGVYQGVRRLVLEPALTPDRFEAVALAIATGSSFPERLRGVCHDIDNLVAPLRLRLEHAQVTGYPEDKVKAIAEYLRADGPRLLAGLWSRLSDKAGGGGAADSAAAVVKDVAGLPVPADPALAEAPARHVTAVIDAWHKVASCYPALALDGANHDVYEGGGRPFDEVARLLEECKDPSRWEEVRARLAGGHAVEEWLQHLNGALDGLLAAITALRGLVPIGG